MTEAWRTITQDFKSIDERDRFITEHADYFTVGRRLGPFEGYERHEVKTLNEAENLAGRMANKAKRAYLIYAVAGLHDCFIKAIHPEQQNA